MAATIDRLVPVFVCLFLAAVVVAISVGIANRLPDKEQPYVPDQPLETITHDGHQFIISDWESFIHHPDCPCGRTK